MDLFVTEVEGYGDLTKAGNDLALAYNLESQIYLRLFGGNDWWANALQEDETTQFASRTEIVLASQPLNSAGLVRIEAAIRYDLAYLLEKVPGTTIVVEILLSRPDRLDITINLVGSYWAGLWAAKDNILPADRAVFKFRVFGKQFTKQFA